MKETLEVERKWLLKDYVLPLGFSTKRVININQYYLSPTERIRYNIINNVSSCQHFFKEWKGEGSSIEKLTNIDFDKFSEYRLLAKKEIFKTRREFKAEGSSLIYEFDFISLSDSSKLIVLEIEFPSIEESKQFILPEEIQEQVIMEVTNHREFSNYELAQIIKNETDN